MKWEVDVVGINQIAIIQNKEGTVKFLNFWMPKNFDVIYLKFKQRGQTLGYFVKNMQMV